MKENDHTDPIPSQWERDARNCQNAIDRLENEIIRLKKRKNYLLDIAHIRRSYWK